MIKLFGLRILTNKEYIANLGAASSMGYKLGWVARNTDRCNHTVAAGGIEFRKVEMSLVDRQIDEILGQSQEAGNGSND